MINYLILKTLQPYNYFENLFSIFSLKYRIYNCVLKLKFYITFVFTNESIIEEQIFL